MQTNCKGCPDRHTGCHANCKTYQDFRQELDRKNKMVREIKKQDALRRGLRVENY